MSTEDRGLIKVGLPLRQPSLDLVCEKGSPNGRGR